MLVNLQVLVKTLDQGVHLLVDGAVVGDFGFDHTHILWLAVLSAVLQNGLAVLIDLLLKSDLSHVELVALAGATDGLAIGFESGLDRRRIEELLNTEV